ncbi:CCAAT/enhancer-binding protein zeta [Lemmus lemmus]
MRLVTLWQKQLQEQSPSLTKCNKITNVKPIYYAAVLIVDVMAVTEDPEEEEEEDSDEAKNGFPLEEVLCLGGTKQDYLMQSTLDENEEVMDGSKKGTIDNLQQGTRMTAMILLIQDDAIHTLQFVGTLWNLVKRKGSKQQCLLALDTFKELLITDLLPDSRKLLVFQPASVAQAVRRQQGLKR